MANTTNTAVEASGDVSGRTPTPWELVASTDHHGPYIISQWGTTICDLYTMSNPLSLSTRNGGDSRPISFVDADANAAFIVQAVNGHDELVAALDACRDELLSVHGVHGDEANSVAHSFALRAAISALAKAKA